MSLFGSIVTYCVVLYYIGIEINTLWCHKYMRLKDDTGNCVTKSLVIVLKIFIELGTKEIVLKFLFFLNHCFMFY